MSTFDPRDLDRLAVDVSHWPFMVSFAQKYRRLLPQRVTRIVSATERGDLDQAMDATLSLRVASSIVGALELVEMARYIETRLRAGDLVGAYARARLLADAAERADLALTSYLVACQDR
ncbi:hypothetical protein NPS01_32430 [Nocardioides psychrotolerans]|uniref:Hpt domain-containing protein n=1 Tax=Nocardioides psychrotolerans TaxID=1005945 RepID=A0A1I3NYT8_9ACTN|nr:Hpt domain-containing protein [Nocardioides psychrotolerans]GEP39580.1 hypothetical protein NPS01_32430 [Nocardioides psychrotolerans]SFJ14361.1 hypothetical protein SAMN05216561_11931 [Nocardioides psychrotolerans]